MSDHDPDLHGRLRDLDPPQHRDGFWADVRAGLGAEAGADAPTPLRPRRVPPRPLLVAAAVVAVVALAGVGVLVTRDDSEPQEVVTEPDPAPGPTAATEPGPSTTDPGFPDSTDRTAGPLQPAGDPVERGSGTPVAVDPQGRFLYVADDAPSGGRGCGDAPAQALYVEPIDGGERRVALPADQLAGAGTIDLFFSGDGQVAARLLCDGTGASLVTGTVSDDRTLGDTFQLTIPDIDTDGTVDVDELTDLAWTPEGQVLATTRLVAGGDVHQHLYSFPPGPSEVSDLEVDGATQVEVTDDGRIVTLHGDGTVRVDGEELFGAEGATVLDVGRVAGDGARSIVAAAPGVRVGSVDAADIGPALPLPDVRGDVVDAETVDGTTTIVYVVAGPDGRSIRAIDGNDPEREGELVATDGSTPLVLAPDGSRLFTVGGGAGDPVVVEQRLER